MNNNKNMNIHQGRNNSKIYKTGCKIIMNNPIHRVNYKFKSFQNPNKSYGQMMRKLLKTKM